MTTEEERKARRKEYLHQWYLKNKEKVLKAKAEWVKNNPERDKEIRRNYRLNNREYINELQRKWYRENPERVKKIKQKHYLTHKEDYKKKNLLNYYKRKESTLVVKV